MGGKGSKHSASSHTKNNRQDDLLLPNKNITQKGPHLLPKTITSDELKQDASTSDPEVQASDEQTGTPTQNNREDAETEPLTDAGGTDEIIYPDKDNVGSDVDDGNSEIDLDADKDTDGIANIKIKDDEHERNDGNDSDTEDVDDLREEKDDIVKSDIGEGSDHADDDEGDDVSENNDNSDEGGDDEATDKDKPDETGSEVETESSEKIEEGSDSGENDNLDKSGEDSGPQIDDVKVKSDAKRQKPPEAKGKSAERRGGRGKKPGQVHPPKDSPSQTRKDHSHRGTPRSRRPGRSRARGRHDHYDHHDRHPNRQTEEVDHYHRPHKGRGDPRNREREHPTRKH